MIIYWPKKGSFPRATSQVTISQVATSQMWNFSPLAQMGGQALWLGWAEGRALWLEQARNRTPSLSQTWEVAAWEIPHFGSCHLGEYPWEVADWD